MEFLEFYINVKTKHDPKHDKNYEFLHEDLDYGPMYNLIF
jgi:hypothetical protein